MGKIRVVQYINQFFAQIGGEEQADWKPEVREGAFGPGLAFATAFGDAAEIVATVICGDSYFNENVEKATAEVMEMIKKYEPDMFIAGPAFNAGRYGVACGSICVSVNEQLNIPVLTGMYQENPGADMYKDKVLMVATRNSAAGMRAAVKVMAPLALKLARGEEILASSVEGYMPNGVRKNLFENERGSARAVAMLLKKISGKEFVTELPMPDFDRVDPSPAVKDLSKAIIGLATSGGIVPKGNPDRIESSNATKYGSYNIAGVMDMTEATYETAHGGYDPVYANEDADRVMAIDILREFEAAGKIGKLDDHFYSTVGNGTAVKSSKAFAAEYAQKMIAAGVTACIMTST